MYRVEIKPVLVIVLLRTTNESDNCMGSASTSFPCRNHIVILGSETGSIFIVV